MLEDNKSYLNDLNDAQLSAVLKTDGPSMVIAGAGSGKTRVLTYKIVHLVNNGVDPFEILALTFTNKAAREMKLRISSMIGESDSKSIWMGTFHSVFAKILRFEAHKIGFTSDFTIYDTQDSERLISSIIKEMNLDKDVYRSKSIRNRISTLKNNFITVNGYFSNNELVIGEGGLPVVETFLTSRSIMFPTVYFHPFSRGAELMLARATKSAINSDIFSYEDFVSYTDHKFLSEFIHFF